ncbi:MAG: hypothetical protein ACKVZ0_17035 [Gemmatimonadales bacterium]
MDTILAEDSGVLSRPADIAFSETGRLFVLDYGDSSILLLNDSATGVERRIGRAGSAPGELKWPIGLVVIGDTIVTANTANGRLERYTVGGQVLPSRPVPVALTQGRVSLAGDGGFTLPVNGEGGALAVLYSADGRPTRRIGFPIVEAGASYHAGAFHDAALRGEVPAYYRNAALVAHGLDSTVWLALTTEGRIQRFGPLAQAPIAELTVNDPTFAAIKAAYTRRNREDSTGRRYHPLLLFADLKVEATRLWVLLNEPDAYGAVVLRIDSEGRVKRRLTINGVSRAWRLAVRTSTRELYLTSADNASLFRVRLNADEWED